MKFRRILLGALIANLSLAACGKKAEEKSSAENPAADSATTEQTVIQYDAIPNYANWGGVTEAYFKKTGVRVPPDMKGSSAAMAALEAEKRQTDGRHGLLFRRHRLPGCE